MAVAGCLWARPADAERFWTDVQEDYRAVGFDGDPPPPERIRPQHLPAESLGRPRLTATFVGFAAGLTTAFVGGAVSWYLFFTPFSFGMGPQGSVPLFGFTVIAASVLTASGLYRHQARRFQHAQAEAARKDVETAELFARELAHRLKNALAVVQSIAVQTVPDDDGRRSAFAARLQELAREYQSKAIVALVEQHLQRKRES